jgi:hypothetical protein
MESKTTVQLRVPKQDLLSLTFDGSSPKKMAGWVEALPMVNVGESSRQLYGAIQELNRFKVDAKARFLILEEMRASIHYVCKSLGKHFINQSIVLNEKETKIANLAQALQNHLAIGYKIVLLETLQQKTAEAAKLRTLATHRALTELSGNLLRCYQLYFPTPAGLWREIHQLYTLAEHYGILDEAIEDKVLKSKLSIEHCYFKTMLLATSRPNQLRQQEIAQLSSAFNIWAEHCELKSSDREVSPFVVDLESDEGAVYAQWNKDTLKDKSSSLRYVHVRTLVDIVRERIQNRETEEKVDFSIKVLSPTVLRHLVQSWSASSQRAFARTQTEGTISLAFGLGAVHHFISGGQDFGKMLSGGKETIILEGEDNPFLASSGGNRNYGFNEEIRSKGDPWALQAVASIEEKPVSKKAEKVQNTFEAYKCNMVDTSPGGYCLEWNGAAPAQLKTGEIISIQEENQEQWSVGVVRWVKKLSTESLRLGLELLAPHAQAVGAKVVQKDGSTTEYMRSIRLPELKAIGQPSTIITPQLTFKEGYKVMLNVDGNQIRLTLTQEIGATASFSQFEYKILRDKAAAIQDKEEEISEVDIPILEKNEDDDEFNSLWTSI